MDRTFGHLACARQGLERARRHIRPSDPPDVRAFLQIFVHRAEERVKYFEAINIEPIWN